MITNKKHNQIIEHKDKTINDYLAKIMKLEQELKEAKDLKLILEKLYPLYEIIGSDSVLSFTNGGYSLNLPDTVLQYTDDILGGKVIKQEGVKCLIVEKDGTVKTGLTKQKVDKGYSYKLIRR